MADPIRCGTRRERSSFVVISDTGVIAGATGPSSGPQSHPARSASGHCLASRQLLGLLLIGVLEASRPRIQQAIETVQSSGLLQSHRGQRVRACKKHSVTWRHPLLALLALRVVTIPRVRVEARALAHSVVDDIQHVGGVVAPDRGLARRYEAQVLPAGLPFLLLLPFLLAL
eukprot:scaffold37623_cov275-Isochrysis_galbana.AAC.1